MLKGTRLKHSNIQKFQLKISYFRAISCKKPESTYIFRVPCEKLYKDS